MRIAPARSAAEREACFDIRRAVFIDEQAIPEAEEWDAADEIATHFLAIGPEGPAGTARLIPDGTVAKIGRVAVAKPHRGTGLGLALMEHLLDHARRNGFASAALDAQLQAIGFYARLGFAAEGPEFDDGSGILHRKMRLDLAGSDAVASPILSNRAS
ncbi:GNAT family N-acetyltransferase [Roseibacterium sp. SDUM158017]|uniref:GNAT family N-acetyltransferase n=1 Tax=Roseicyclus salinarum TaxID=3036773 RepID=UPI0024150CC9|nr:GNAT family N-acetyltransferase [Roseibacterium sp. SDUM158017]MDG4647099.1 GNAT family N-acetyltransferase [Roseibacterium sp. SDUM158017]